MADIMTDEECEKVYNQILVYLKKHGLEWLVENIEADVSEGKDKKKQVNAYRQGDKDSETDMDLHESPGKSTYWGTVAYTGKEKLLSAIEATEETIIETAFMEQAFFEVCRDEKRSQNVKPLKGSVGFKSEYNVAPNHEFTSMNISERISSAVKLRELLQELRKAI